MDLLFWRDGIKLNSFFAPNWRELPQLGAASRMG
jgi:hypothetical protein